jgi:hypothetical protein
MKSAWFSGAIVLIGFLSASAVAQTPKQDSGPPPDVEVLAQRMPDCKEFRNACQVCASRLTEIAANGWRAPAAVAMLIATGTATSKRQTSDWLRRVIVPVWDDSLTSWAR